MTAMTRNSDVESKSKKVDESENQATQLLDKLDSLASESETTKGRPPSAQRTQATNNPVPPADRLPGPQGIQNQALDTAIGAISGAKAQVLSQIAADKALRSDPRYERDLEVLKAGQEGRLGLVPKTEEEVAAELSHAGIEAGSEIVDKIPKSSEQQATRDMARLQEAKETQSKQKEDTTTTTRPTTASKTETPDEKKDRERREREKESQNKPTSTSGPIPSANKGEQK